MSLVYLNGKFLPDTQACVPVLDRGFIFGDGIYEMIPSYGGKAFRLHEHLQRLGNNLYAVRMQNPYTDSKWADLIEQLIEKNNFQDKDASIYLQVTRGVAKRDHAFPQDSEPTVVLMCNPLAPLADEMLQYGAHAITADDFRWVNCHIKATSLLPNVLLRQQAVDANASETILIRDGKATEGAASNIFIVENGTIKTPPTGPLLLPGITRDLVLELARENDLAAEETDITAEQLKNASEIWLSSSTKEVMPVTMLDAEIVGSGEPGPVWRNMYELYQQYKQSLRQPSTADKAKPNE